MTNLANNHMSIKLFGQDKCWPFSALAFSNITHKMDSVVLGSFELNPLSHLFSGLNPGLGRPLSHDLFYGDDFG